MVSIEITPRAVDKATQVLSISGELDINTATRLNEHMEGLLSTTTIERLVFDLGGVKYIDSSGLLALINAVKRINERQGQVVFSSVTPHVEKVFHVTGLLGFFRLYQGEAEALRQMEALP